MQELLDAARRLLVSNHEQLHQLSAKSGMQAPDDMAAYTAFSSILAEWDAQMTAHHAGKMGAMAVLRAERGARGGKERGGEGGMHGAAALGSKRLITA